ncbi:hypothetical protein HDU98_008129 [Podochytrium sp. JEL0797]|nr:hypothetical protein HDU98_008129 [Podochytrium sp. JEL0797]
MEMSEELKNSPLEELACSQTEQIIKNVWWEQNKKQLMLAGASIAALVIAIVVVVIFHPKRFFMTSVQKLQTQVDEATKVMGDNLSKILNRGEDLEHLVDNTEHLSNEANKFKSNAHEVRKNMWWKSVKMQLILSALIVSILIIIIVAVVLTQNHSNGVSMPSPSA